MYDYFVARMTCTSCGASSAADSSTNMQTHVRDDARGIEIAAGFELDPLEVRDQDLRSSGYLATGRPRSDGATRLIESWTCPVCKHENWARVTIDGTRVSAIEGIALDRAALEGAQFITDGCYVLAARLSGLPAQDLMTGVVDPVRVLFERLP